MNKIIKLTGEQNDIAYYKNTGNLVVKGVAGSGKTVVGLHRIPYLKEYLCNESTDNILVISYTKTLVSYLSYLLERDQLNDGMQHSLMKKNVKVDVTNIDSLIHKFSRQWTTKDFLVKREFEDAVKVIRQQNEKVRILKEENLEFLRSEIDWIRACNIRSLEEYQTYERKGRGTEFRIGKNSKIREVIYEVLELYHQKLEEKGYIDWLKKDLEVLDVNIPEYRKYTHIIIDEAQDLSKTKLEFIKKLKKDTPNSSMMFLYDSSQSIYENSWLGSGRSFKSLGLDVLGRKTKILTQSFRTTKEIHSAAHNMLLKDEEIAKQEGFIKPEFLNSNGIKPFFSYSKTFEDQINSVAKLITNLKNKYKYKDNEIMIASKNAKSLEKISLELNKYNVNNALIKKNGHDFTKDQVGLITIHSIKGLESKVVILLDINEGVIPKITEEGIEDEDIRKDRKLLYVGMTRASEILYISSWGEKSRFIDDFDEGYLNIVTDENKSFDTNYEEGIVEVEIKNKREGKSESERFKIAKELYKEKIKKKLQIMEDEKKRIEALYNELLFKYEKDKEKQENKSMEIEKENELLATDLEAFSSEKTMEKENEIDVKNKEIGELIGEIEKLKANQKEHSSEKEKLKEALEEIEKLKKEQKQINETTEKNIKEIGGDKTKELEENYKRVFPDLSKENLITLVSVEYDFLNRPENYDLDYSSMYGSLIKIVEKLFKNFLLQTEETYTSKDLTFGSIMKEAKRYTHFRNVVFRLEQINAIKMRNHGIHSGKIDRSEFLELRNLLIEKKMLNEILLAIESQYNSSNTKLITLKGVLEGGGNTIKFNKKTYYTHLLNNDVMVLSLDLIKNKMVQIEGYHDMRDGNNFFIVKKYKEI